MTIYETLEPQATVPPPETAGEPIGDQGAEERGAESPFPIVGIGASAGGLEAFTQFLAHLSDQTGMAFVLVQHLDPRHESRLTEILARSTHMPVLEATDGLEVCRDQVYVIPPNTNMAISQGALRVTPRGEAHGPHLPIDHFLRALAEAQHAQAIGVVLSGTGSDGTLGLCEIKAVGGISFAQDPGSARHSGMPSSAIDSGSVDFVLAPEEIAKRLGAIGCHPYLAPTRAMADGPAEAEDQFKRILVVVRAATGVNFGLYRDTTIRRRIMRRMALHGQQALADYAGRLEQDSAEVEALYRDLLINVTSFFRDPALFETLKSSVFPEIVKAKTLTAPLRLWVPGCSTGQEAYSLAIALWEFFDGRPARPSIQVFATDLSDAQALERARTGLYPESIEAEVSPERLRRFFKKEDHVYRIDKSIRDVCVFARQNITADPPFSHVDLISCRNVLTYMAPALQKRVLPTFHYALNVPGFLVLGSSETVGGFTTLFEVAERGHKIYAKKVTGSRPLTHFAVEDYKTMATAGHRAGPPSPTPTDFQKAADRLLLGRYAPPGVLVNEHFEILQFRGHTARYLEVPPGEPTLSLLQMARQGLFLELRSALIEAKERNEAVCRGGVRVQDEHGIYYEVTLQVLPVEPWGAVRCYLVLFEEPTRCDTAGPSVVSAAEGPDGAAPLAGWFAWLHQWGSGRARPAPAEKRAVPGERDEAPASLPETAMLRQELAATREYLQSLIEQQDAANEELRSANEEILSSNEELQSTNEELETAKEELQSTNEELSTVNEQLQHRNLELNQTTNDLNNLLTSTTIPVLMVGLDLRIRRLTPPARKIMNLLPTDVGRPIGDLKANMDVPDLEVLIAEVIGEVQVREREVRDPEGRWYSLRVHPYRTTDNKIDGAVVVLLDIDEIKRTQEAMRLSEERLSLAVHGTGMATWDVDLKIGKALWSETHFRILGYDPVPGGEATLEMWQSRVHADDRERVLRALEQARSERSLYAPEHRIIRADNGEERWISVFGRFLYDEAGEAARFVGVMYDVTERKDVEALKEVDRRKDEFLATLAHELRNPLAAIGNAVRIMRFCGDDPAQAAETRDMLERQLRQLVRIVDDLLDVSRIVEGKIDLRKERVTLEAVVKTAVETSRSFIEASGHELTVTLPPEPVDLDADPVRLAQVLSNLLNNAAKFTEAGGRIWLAAETSSENPPASSLQKEGPPHSPPSQGGPRASPPSQGGVGGVVVIRVRDTGIGMPAVLLPRIFAMFTQADRSLERSRGGLGLGLTLARSLVQMHGGTIEAHSAGPGQGSELVVRLPRAAEGLEARDAAAQEGSGRQITGSPRRRILVVDDDRDVARSTGALLNLMGHEVRMTHDGPSALEAATAFVPDVALIDIGLPGMNGYEVAGKMRARLQDVVLIAQTGYGQEAQRRRAKEAGFDIHLTKPVDFDQLEQVLGSMPSSRGPAHEGALR